MRYVGTRVHLVGASFEMRDGRSAGGSHVDRTSSLTAVPLLVRGQLTEPSRCVHAFFWVTAPYGDGTGVRGVSPEGAGLPLGVPNASGRVDLPHESVRVSDETATLYEVAHIRYCLQGQTIGCCRPAADRGWTEPECGRTGLGWLSPGSLAVSPRDVQHRATTRRPQ